MPLKVIPNDESSLTKGEKQLLNVETIYEKKLLYVGITRALA